MSKLILKLSAFALIFLLTPHPAFAQTPNVSDFTNRTLTTIIAVASLAAVFFLIKGGYLYITSSGKPDALENAKSIIKKSLIGLVLILSAAVFSSFLSNSFTASDTATTTSEISLSPVEPAEPEGGLTQILLDAIAGFLQNIVQSATTPLINGVVSFLTTTPSLTQNSVIFKFWLVTLGITNSLFVLVIALLGLHFMSAQSFGFEEVELRQLLPKIGLAFLGANSSIFLADWIITSANVLTQAVLATTGGLSQAWILTAFDPAAIATGTTPLITIIFMLLFVILAVVLLLLYISRLIILSLGAVLSPFIFLLWLLPKFSDFAEISVKTYIVTVYIVFVHVVMIQLASAFITPGQEGTNAIISILVAIGLFFTLLKTPSTMSQLVFYTTSSGTLKKVGGQIMNVVSTTAGKTSQVINGAKVAKRRRMA